MTRDEVMKKWKKGEGENSSLSSYQKGDGYKRYAERQMAKAIDSSYNKGVNALNNIYAGWNSESDFEQNRAIAQSTADSLNEARNRYGIDTYDDLLNDYYGRLKGIGQAADVYSKYLTEDAYNKAQKDYGFSQKYNGYSYADIQKALSSVEDQDEADFLKGYTKFSSLEDFDQALATATGDYKKGLTREREAYEKAHRFDKYADIVNRPDFEANSDPTQIINAEHGLDADFYVKNKKIFDRSAFNGSYNAAYLSDMNEEMQRIGAYILNTTHDQDAYLEFIRDMTDYTRNEQAREKEEYWANLAENNPVGTSIASTLLQPIVGGLAGIETAVGAVTGQNSIGNVTALSSAMAQANAKISQNIKEATKDLPWGVKELPSIAYDVFTTSVPNRIGEFLFGPGYTTVMGLSSFATTYADEVSNGTDTTSALWKAFASGAIETLTELIPWEKAFGNGKTWYTTMAKQMFYEGSEEAIGALANLAYDMMANGGYSEIQQKIASYVEMGYDQDEASKRAWSEFRKDVARQFVVGALAVAPTTGTAQITQAVQESSAGKFINREKLGEINNEDLKKKYGDEWTQKASNREVYKAYSDYVGNLQNESAEAEKKATAQAIAQEYKISDEEATKWAEALYNGDKKMLKTHFGQALTEDVNNREGWTKAIDTTETTKIASKLNKAFSMIKTKDQVSAEKASKAIKTGEKNLVNGKEAQIISMTENKDGSYTVKTSEGEVNAKDVTVTEQKATALTYSANIKNEAFKEAYVRYYAGEDIADYDTYARYLYNAGRQGIDYSDKTNILDTLGVAKAQAIYNVGALEALQEEIEDARLVDEVTKKYAEKFRPGTFKSGEYKNGKFKENKDFFRNLNRTQKRLYKIVESFSKLSGVNVRTYLDRDAASENGQFIAGKNGGTIYINLAARPFADNAYGINQYVISTLSHELTHWLKANNREAYDILEEAVKKDLQKNSTFEKRLSTERETLLKTHENELKEAGKSEEEIKAEMEKYEQKKDLDEIALEEVVARACEDMLNDADTMQEVLSFADQDGLTKLQSALKKWFDHIRGFFRDLMGGFHAPNEVVADLQKSYAHLQELWVNGMKEAIAQNRREQKTTENKKAASVKNSVKQIIGNNGTNYGMGVYLDSTLLTNLTDDERKEMVKERVKELGGQLFTAFDPVGNPVDVKVAEYKRRFINKNGKKVRVNKDLIRKNNTNTKQEAVVLADELIETSHFAKDSASKYSHGWLDDNGNNRWEYWDTYIEDRDGVIWKATLNIANADTGEKILYDIDPIKEEGQAVKSATSLPKPTISHSNKQSNNKSVKLSSMGYTDQEHTSAGTSLKQNASTFTTYQFDDGERILDWGGGRYDISKRVVEKSYNNVTFEAVDQFNRTEEHNSRVLKEFAKNKATSLTINNVFNVIDSEATIESILAESKKYLKDNGMCYIHIYTGNRSGIGKETSAGYQRNETADKYEKYVKKYYKNVRRAGDFILASDGEIKVKRLDEVHKNLIKKNTETVSKMNDLDMRESRYSTKMDSEGRTLSEEQQNYFEDSKARDDQGRLLVMYHGTDSYEDFTVFKAGKDGYLGKGIYFTEKESIAKRYAEQNGYKGRIYKVYLNVKNPLIVTSENPALEILGEKVAKRRAEKNSFSTKWLTSADIKKLQAKGYDGIIWKYGKSPVEISVWDSNQIKLTTNENPTPDKDIRRSVKMDSNGKKLSEGQQTFFEDESVLLLDENGSLKRYYHGTSRMDRVGTVFDPAKATSGPMAFFTDSKDIAANYSKDKADTSLSRDERYNDYHTQFRITLNGKDMSVSEAWNRLPMSKRNEIKQKAEHVTLDDEAEEIIYDPNNKEGIGDFNAYEINFHKGNYLDTLVSSWLDSGTLWNREADFLEVLKMVGLDDVTYLDPNFKDAGVYEVYLHITNPFDTSNISKADIDAIRKASQTAKTEERYSADMWDKTNFTPKQWLEKFEADIEEGTSHSFTTIPDWVTETLISRGYDGIVDKGGKYHEVEHQVVIPFYSEQIKDINNENPTKNKDIRKSTKMDSEGNTLTPGQQKRFKDSKARDEQGRLLRLYHGTSNAGFTEFKAGGFFNAIWLTTSKKDAGSYGGASEEFKPGEKQVDRKITGTDKYMIGKHLRFESQEDKDKFLKKFPNANEYKDRWEMEKLWSNYYENVEENDSGNKEAQKLYKIEEESKKIEQAYVNYGLTVNAITQMREMLDNPDDYDVLDYIGAFEYLDSNSSPWETWNDSNSAEEYKEVLIDAIRYTIENDEDWSLDDMPVPARIPVGQTRLAEDTTRIRHRIYSLYADIKNPLILDGHGKNIAGSSVYTILGEFNQDKYQQYDGIISRNTRVGAYKNPGDVVVVRDSSQLSWTGNENPTESPDILKSVKLDSNGNTLTEGQQNYFKDSKVVDDQGRLLVVYHGTYEDFEAFKPNKFTTEKNGLSKIVGYFSEDKEYAKIYGDTKAYYLNIKNPLVMDGEAKTLKGWEKFFKANGVTDFEFDSSVTGKNGQADPLKGGRFEDGTYYAFYELLDSSEYWYGDGNLSERIQVAGYDGIQSNDEFEKAWMPFNAEAVKSVDNANPTDSESVLKSTKLPPEAQKLVDELTLENKRLTEENTALKMERGLEKVQAEKRAIIDKITEQSQVLSRWLLTNDKTNPVPQAIKEPLGKLLTSISFTKDDYEWRKSKGNLTKAEETLGQRMAKISQLLLEIEQDKAVDKDAYDLSQLDWIPEFTTEFAKIKDAVAAVEARQGENFNLSKMSTEDLKSLSNMITALKSAITNMNKCLSAHNKESVSGVGQEIISYLDSIGQKKFDNRATQFLEMDNTVPFYFFKRLGAGGQKAFKLLMDGMNQYAFEAKQIEDYAKEVFSGKDVNAWRNEVKTFTVDEIEYGTVKGEDLVQPRKKTIQMTVPQIMSLYCLSKRDQAVNHLKTGGIKIGDFKVKGAKETTRQIENTTLTKASLETIINSLTAEQKEVADKLQEFMNTTCQKWGNEVTMKRFGFKGMTEKNYFPIKVDQNQLSREARQRGTSLYQLLNMGFTKPINPKAKNPIEIFDIFEVFAMHSTEMAQYHSLALPVLDVIRIWNYKDVEMLDESEDKAHWHSVKASIENTLGAQGNRYIGLLLADMNGDVSGGRADDFAGKMMKNYKTAAVAANLQVAALQPLSYIRAGYMIDSKYLAKGMAMKSTKEALKWCGIAVWKDMGFYNTSIHRGLEHKIMQDESKKESIIEKGLYLAGKADEWTWSKLWNACLLETQDKYPALKGDDLYRQTAERLTEVIYGTQVVDSILTRSQIMRDKTMYSKMITAFQSEPTLALNVLMDAAESFSMEARRSGKQAALKKYGETIRRAATIYLISSAVESLLRAVIGKIRNYDGDEDDENLIVDFFKRFIEELNPLRKIPIIKDAWSILFDGLKVIFGWQYKIYTDTRMDEAIFENLGKATIRIGNLIKGKAINYKVLYEIAKGIDASGVPVSSTFRAFKVLWNNTVGRIWPGITLK